MDTGLGETDLAYIAGIVDGEGHIQIIRFPAPKKKSTPGWRTTIAVDVTNTDEWLINYLFLNFGGTVYEVKHNNLKWKRCWRWAIRANKAERFLSLILPYLHLKKPHAELAIKFQRIKDQRPKYSKCRRKTEAEFAIEEAQLILSRKVNQ